MKFNQVLATTVALLALPWVASAEAQTGQCPFSIENRRPVIAYKPLPAVNPRTGQALLPGTFIDMLDDNGKVLLDTNGAVVRRKAEDVLKELNDLERQMNEWGYTLRENGDALIGAIDSCPAELLKQTELIEGTLSKVAQSWWGMDKDLSKLEEKWDEYQDKIPSWDDLQQLADTSQMQVNLPPVAPMSPRPGIKRLEPVTMEKERFWSFEKGNPKKFMAGAEVGFSVRSGKTRADAHATGAVKGGLFGLWEGDILRVNVDADANNDEQQSDNSAGLGAAIKILGGTVWQSPDSWRVKSLKKDDKWEFSKAYGVTYRFSVGPIPMAAEIGFNGGFGLIMGMQVVPIQVGAYAVPYAFAEGYAQVGVDIGVAGGGVGAALVFIDEHFTISGVAGMTFDDEPKITLELTGVNELNTLAGRIYAYAYVNYFFGKKTWRYNLFEWEGFKHNAEAFRFRTVWTPSGVTIEGDATKEDLALYKAQSQEIDVTKLENDSSQHLQDEMEAIRKDLGDARTAAIGKQDAALTTLDKGIQDSIKAYWVEAKRWGVAN